MSEKEKKRIIVIDDDEDITKLISLILENAGYEVEISLSAHEALNKIFTTPSFNLIILDIAMPDMDGWEFLDIIRSRDETNKVPVMIISARTGIRSKALAIQRGAQDFITKPFTRMELITRVENLIPNNLSNKLN
ncbi:MAG: hypothetical protein DRH51_01675 [Candidatus Coatesbacteria bacterium]|nr:MAG: hypothetical protein DRH51_01675 [Candidatus Coatesbacteria bacterium]